MTRPSLIVTTLILLGHSACVYFPRDGQELSNRSVELNFSGYTSKPNEAVQLMMFDYQTMYDQGSGWGQWVPLVTFRSANDPTTFENGGRAYLWQGRSPLLQDPRYWEEVDGTQMIRAALYAKAGESAQSYSHLDSFRTDVNTCWSEKKGQGLNDLEIYAACKSPNSPSILVYAPCGHEGTACCLAYRTPVCRTEGTDCDADFICTREEYERRIANVPSFGVGQIRTGLYDGRDGGGGDYPQSLAGYGSTVSIPDAPDPGRSGLDLIFNGDSKIDHSQCYLAGEKTCCLGPPPFGGPQLCRHRYACPHPDYVTGVYRYGGAYVCGICMGIDC